MAGQCNNPAGHGHNYKLEVTVCGPVDRRTGFVMDVRELKTAIALALADLDHKNLDLDVAHFRGSHTPAPATHTPTPSASASPPTSSSTTSATPGGADTDTQGSSSTPGGVVAGERDAGWDGAVSSSENLVVFIWRRLIALLPRADLLHELKLHETDKNVFLYRASPTPTPTRSSNTSTRTRPARPRRPPAPDQRHPFYTLLLSEFLKRILKNSLSELF